MIMAVLLSNTYGGPCQVCTKLLVKKAEDLLRLAGLKGHELSILLLDDPAMQEINREWRHKDKATNVLSFPQGVDDYLDLHPMLGDIIISIDTAQREAIDRGISLHQHLTIL